VPAIHQKRTLAFVNTFITNTVSILNNLARTSEAKMQKFEEKLQRMDASLCILEANVGVFFWFVKFDIISGDLFSLPLFRGWTHLMQNLPQSHNLSSRLKR